MKKSVSLRDTQIKKWRAKHISQNEIARRLGVTRQRVQQIERLLGLGPRRVPGVYVQHEITCRQCGKTKFFRTAGRTYCSRECFHESRKQKKLSPEQFAEHERVSREKNRIRAQKYYHLVFKKRPDWQKIVKQRNKKYPKKYKFDESLAFD